MTAILSETFFVWFRVSLEIQPESYGLRRALGIVCYMTLYAYTVSSVYTLLFVTQLHLTTKLMYLMTACMYYAPKGAFTANNASFYKNKFG